MAKGFKSVLILVSVQSRNDLTEISRAAWKSEAITLTYTTHDISSNWFEL